MNLFPTQYSTLSAIALGDYIQDKYGLENLVCRLLIRNVSDTYILAGEEDPAEKYIFKVYRDSYRKSGEIKGEVEMLNILKDRGVPVAYPIPDLSGNQVQQFQAAEGIRNGVLFSFAKSKVFINPDEEQLRIIGRNIALIHNVTSVCTLQHERVVYDTGSTLERPLKIISHRFQEMPGEYAFLRDMTDRTIKKIKQFDVSKFSYGYCHYDLLSKNFHFDENNAITFFDFDWLGRGFLVNDLMTFYIQLFFLEHYNMITREEADRNFGVLLEGYREQRNLSAEEVEAIPWLGVMFWIFGFGFYEDNFDDFSNTFLTPKFIRDRVAMIKKWVDNYC